MNEMLAAFPISRITYAFGAIVAALFVLNLIWPERTARAFWLTRSMARGIAHFGRDLKQSDAQRPRQQKMREALTTISSFVSDEDRKQIERMRHRAKASHDAR